MKKYNNCITYGTYDLFHYGHVRLLRRIKRNCRHLIVGVSSDEFNAIKGKKSFDDYVKRSKNVLKSPYVDMIIAEEHWEQKEQDIKNYSIDCFIMGSDWKFKFDYLNNLCEVKYLKRTPFISSTYLRSKKSNNLQKKQQK